MILRCCLHQQQQLLRSGSLFQTWNYSTRNSHRFRVFLFIQHQQQFSPIKSSSAKVNGEEEGNGLKQKVVNVGINYGSCNPGEYEYLICPMCKGGQSKERSLSFHITQNEKVAIWRCFNFECGWAGHVLADVGPAEDGVNKVNIPKQLSEETLGLEPLGDELIDYFSKRMISVETLHKNAVMQMADDKNVIAYTYRRNGEIVSCKFRSVTNRKFWQAKHGKRILYGLDDIKEGNDIVIVEGEIDKLSMEEAGILNCVSVPDGAPQQVSTIGFLPSKKQEARFKYLTDCNGHLDKASRIVLATDGDGPGQALAEELSCRLGKERCWLVTWPKKDDLSCYKDANEVLVHLGAEALRRIVETAELYQVKKNSL
ncbi:primase homolog protein-like [Rutidosis leptorrhynchoides]|uniref:primase homolog protein-like n=1 Tax=Rutidosis leptorrhynchoides TaxID=125765 RepID=UPI003A991D5E